jgi:predicted TIM-barrel fold metal-dependent hydrolase
VIFVSFVARSFVIFVAGRHGRPWSDVGPIIHAMIDRRHFLATIAAAGATGLAWTADAAPGLQAGAPASRTRIDTHHHVFPPPYVDALDSGGLADAIAKSWSVARTLEDMDRAGVETSILSVTTPAVTFAESAVARRVARESNEWVAGLVRDTPRRFGSFAMVPMPDVDGTLREIEYALDILKADGIGFLTSYGDKWLGHAAFAPVMQELNRRKAVVYTHPTLANCCRNLLPDVAPTIVEYGADTSRTVADLVFSGTATRCPDAHFIFSHAGGTVPFLVERFARATLVTPALQPRVPNGALAELQRFYYDTAWSAHRGALAALTSLVPVSQVLFGSDYPYRTGADHVKGLTEYRFSAADMRAIGRDNAARLIPRLR